ncbi:MAG: TIGR03435 family protein [Terriglobales bacterium]
MHAFASPLSSAVLIRLAWVLIQFLWQGAVIAALYALARACWLRRSGPAGRYRLACVALALMAAAPLVTWRLATPPAAAPAALVAPADSPSAHAAGGAGLSSWPAALDLSVPTALPAPLLDGLAGLWLAGALFFWLRLASRCMAAARLKSTQVSAAPAGWQARFERLQRRLRIARPVRLCRSACVQAPAVVGWLRPVVLVPASAFTGLSTGQLEAILLHELAHVRRFDYAVNLLQRAVEASLFYHPAVWWISGQISAEREFCCDDVAVAASGDALTYAGALAELEAARAHGLAVAATGGSLLRRIARVLGGASRPHAELAGPGASGGMFLAAAACLGLLLGAQTPASTASMQFEVASLKPTLSSRGGVTGGCHGIDSTFAAGDDRNDVPLGRCVMHFARLSHMMETAYGRQYPQISGYPDWDGPSRWDLDAKAANPAAATAAQLRTMFRNLLVRRFHLVLHAETKVVPVFVLTIGKNGPKFHPSASKQASTIMLGNNAIIFKNNTMAQLADFLSNLPAINRPVLDKTGLRGEFDFTLNIFGAQSGGAGDTKRAIGSWTSAIPDIASQLGLKFEPQKSPVTTLVIDHAAKPTPN